MSRPKATRRSMTWCVYAIIDPRTDGLFYVGQTRSFARRRAEHLDGTDQISGLVIRQIREAGFLPHFLVLERHDNEETALRAEIYWIETLLARGIELTNAQAFGGYQDRRNKRRSETEKLAEMQRLREVANGRTSKQTTLKQRDPKQSARKPKTAVKNGWRASDIKRLKGMRAHGLAIKQMVKILDRSEKDIRAELAKHPLK